MEYNKVEYCIHNFPNREDSFCPKCRLEWQIEFAYEDLRGSLETVNETIEKIHYAIREFKENRKFTKFRFSDPEEAVREITGLNLDELDKIKKVVLEMLHKIHPFEKALKERS